MKNLPDHLVAKDIEKGGINTSEIETIMSNKMNKLDSLMGMLEN